jgi:hypothetical protein
MDAAVKYYPVRGFDEIRITCHHRDCYSTIELEPSKVEAAMAKTKGCCPICDKPFTNPKVDGGTDVISMLAKVILALNGLAEQVTIEFPISVSE